MYERYEALDKCREVLQKQKLLHVDMTELIARGQAELVYSNGATVCLYDMVSGIYFHTTDHEMQGRVGIEKIKAHAIQNRRSAGVVNELGGQRDSLEIEYLALHQEYMQKAAEEILGVSTAMVCTQAVYTKKEIYISITLNTR